MLKYYNISQGTATPEQADKVKKLNDKLKEASDGHAMCVAAANLLNVLENVNQKMKLFVHKELVGPKSLAGLCGCLGSDSV